MVDDTSTHQQHMSNTQTCTRHEEYTHASLRTCAEHEKAYDYKAIIDCNMLTCKQNIEVEDPT